MCQAGRRVIVRAWRPRRADRHPGRAQVSPFLLGKPSPAEESALRRRSFQPTYGPRSGQLDRRPPSIRHS